MMARAFLLVTTVAAALTAGACGGATPSTEGGKTTASTNTPATVEATAEEASGEAYDACESQLDPFLKSLTELDSRLDIGLSYDEYGDQVADVKVEYDTIRFDDLELDCTLSVGVPAEKALNKYVDAFQVWDTCFSDIDCDNDSIEPKLQRHWSAASTAVENAAAGLEDLHA